MLSLAKVLPTFLLRTLPSPNKNAADKINKMGLLSCLIIYYFLYLQSLTEVRDENLTKMLIKACFK